MRGLLGAGQKSDLIKANKIEIQVSSLTPDDGGADAAFAAKSCATFRLFL